MSIIPPFEALTGILASVDEGEGGFRAVETMFKRAKKNGDTIYFIGNGGSAGIASHLATDFMKNGGFRAMAFNDGSMLTCVSNDLGYHNVFSLPVQAFGRPADILVAISSSGQSRNIINAVSAAKTREMSTITLSGFEPDNPLRTMGNVNFWVPSRRYGHVEIAHLAICHHILDNLMGLQ